jgi:hypothetical protein
MLTLMNNKPFSLKVLGVGERSASLLTSSSNLNTFESIMGPYADKAEGKIDIELAEENRVARANQVLVSNAMEYQKYLHEREQSRREAVRIERERLDMARERFEDDERWKLLARHMEYHRNLVRLRSRPSY